MKRFFVLFSIILLLGSNIAMALDADCVSLSIDEQSQSLTDNDVNYDIDSDYPDNCCHSASHFVGIYPDNIYHSSVIANRFIAVPFSLSSSQTYQPATPPPNV